MISLRMRFISIAFFSVSLPALALEETSKRPELALGTMLGSLVLVLACIFLFAFLMKKSNLIRHRGYKSPIKVIATQALTNKSRVQIIEVHGKQYLLGVSEQSVNLIEQLETPIQTEMNQTDAQNTPSLAAAFAQVLSSKLANNKGREKNND